MGSALTAIALPALIEHDLSRKPPRTIPDHALARAMDVVNLWSRGRDHNEKASSSSNDRGHSLTSFNLTRASASGYKSERSPPTKPATSSACSKVRIYL